MHTIHNFAALCCAITLTLLAGCGSSSRALPIPAREANLINQNIMGLVAGEVGTAQIRNLLRPDAAYTNSDPAVVITGSYIETPSENTTHATVQIQSLSFQIAPNTYWVTAGRLNYDYAIQINGENTTAYWGNFTLTRGLESWECRWPELKKVITRNPETEQLVTRQFQGSYVIDGVTYSYPRE